MANTHAISRTSPKGGPFFGTCFKCGTTDLPAQAVSWPCENPANLSSDEALLHAINPASAIEARSDATGTGAAEGESAVPQGDAQPEPSHD